PGPPAGSVPVVDDVPPHLPVRVPLGRAYGRSTPLGRPTLPDPQTRPLRALRRRLHRLPYLRGDAPRRPLEAFRGRAAELLGVARPLRPLRRRLRLDPVRPSQPEDSRAPGAP